MPGAFKDILGVHDIRRGIWKPLLAEFIGNFLLNYYGCASCVNVSAQTGQGDNVIIALTFGLCIMAIVQSIGHISGAHVNPAVTFGMLITGHISILKAILYVIVQCLGAICGSAVLKAVTPSDAQGNLGTTLLGKDVLPVQGLGVEFFLGFVLVLVVFAMCDVNRPDVKGKAPFAIGLTISMGHLAALNYTGSSMNPARSLGSVVVSMKWSDHWVYWLGPILGGAAAAVLYQHCFAAPAPIDASSSSYIPVQVQDDKELKRLDKKDEDGMA